MAKSSSWRSRVGPKARQQLLNTDDRWASLLEEDIAEFHSLQVATSTPDGDAALSLSTLGSDLTVSRYAAPPSRQSLGSSNGGPPPCVGNGLSTFTPSGGGGCHEARALLEAQAFRERLENAKNRLTPGAKQFLEELDAGKHKP